MTNDEKTEKQILADIKSGKYREHYLIYNRKSTDEPNSQKNSIAYQKKENTKLAKREKLRIAPITLKGLCVSGVISERHSGFKEDNNIFITKNGMVQYRIERPKFQKLAQFLSQGYFKGVIFLSWDRASRNKGDDTIIGKLMRNGVSVRFAFAQYDNSSAGALHMDVDGMFAAHHSRVTSEKVKLATRNLRSKGVCTYRAPIGYLNEGNMYDKPFDPVRAPLIKKMFELCAEGQWSLSDLARWANKVGLTTVPSRRRRTEEELLAEEEENITIKKTTRPIKFTHVHKILTNRFYTGRILNNDGEFIKSVSHEALITDTVFERVQSILQMRNISTHYETKKNLALRGKVRCDKCKRAYSPYMKKGIQYFKSTCSVNCTNTMKSFNLSFIEDEVGKLIKQLSFTEDELEEIDARADTDVAVLEHKRHQLLEDNQRQITKLRDDLLYLRENRLILLKSELYSPDQLLEEEKDLTNQINSLQLDEQISDISMHKLMKDVILLSELLKDGYKLYQNADSQKKEEIINLVFFELTLSGNDLKYKGKNGFKALENRFSFVCDHIRWFFELTRLADDINESIEDMKIILKGK